MSKAKFIAIKNLADSTTLELYFLDVICDTYDYWSGMSYSKMQEIIDKVNYYNPSKIKVIIDSIGGDAQTGLSIYNFLKNYNAKVEVEVLGLAGSIASVVAMAANKGKLSIAKNAFMMIHQAEGVGCGKADELRQYADLVDKYTDQIIDVYVQRTGKTADEIKALIAGGDYWMTGDEAVAQGFADSVFNETPNLEIAARLKDLPEYKNIPLAIKNLIKPDDQSQEQSFFNTQFNEMKKFFTDIVNAIKNVKPAAAGDNTTITNQIAEAVTVPFEKLADEIDSTITNSVTNAIKGEDFIKVMNEAISVSVTAATKDLTDKVNALETAKTELEKKNSELETEIANKLGNKTGNQNQEGPKAIGGFNK